MVSKNRIKKWIYKNNIKIKSIKLVQVVGNNYKIYGLFECDEIKEFNLIEIPSEELELISDEDKKDENTV